MHNSILSTLGSNSNQQDGQSSRRLSTISFILFCTYGRKLLYHCIPYPSKIRSPRAQSPSCSPILQALTQSHWMKFHIFRLNLSDRSRTRVGKEKEDEGELQWRKKALDEKFYTGTKKMITSRDSNSNLRASLLWERKVSGLVSLSSLSW